MLILSKYKLQARAESYVVLQSKASLLCSITYNAVGGSQRVCREM